VLFPAAPFPRQNFPIRFPAQSDEDKSLINGACNMMKLFVGNLSFQTTQEDLMNTFARYGAVESVNLLTDRMTGQSRGFGFVEMTDRSEAQNAINALNGAELNGRAMNVNEARPKEDRGGFGGNKPKGGFGGPKKRREPRW
jgi:cold-inducible RNA-binding protein